MDYVFGRRVVVPEKAQGEPVCYETFPRWDWIDGPARVYAETEGGEKYYYTSYALGVDSDEISASMLLWSGVSATISELLEDAPTESQFKKPISDPVILWRQRPSISEENGKFQIFMRFAIVPRDETFLPAKPLTVGEQIAKAV